MKGLRKISSLLIAFVMIATTMTVQAFVGPGAPTGYVNDFASVLSQSEKTDLENKLREVESSTGAEISVVTVKTIGRDETIESYAVKLFEEWGIGKSDVDNGVLLLFAMEEREVRIEVGYGLEGTIPDLRANRIIQDIIIPSFRSGQYYEGIDKAADSIVGLIKNDPEAMRATEPSQNIRSTSSWDFNPFAAFFFLVVVIDILVRILSKSKSWWLGGVIGAIIGGVITLVFALGLAGVILTVIFIVLGLIFDYVVSKKGPWKGGGPGGMWLGGFGSGSGGSGFGGGFGGFGGGSSGGGGASGRW